MTQKWPHSFKLRKAVLMLIKYFIQGFFYIVLVPVGAGIENENRRRKTIIIIIVQRQPALRD